MEAEKQFRKRNAILACLRGTKTHPSADMVYEMLLSEHSDISRATVYRNLAHFKEQGLIISLGTVNGIERFDGRIDPHVHFSCCRCGNVEDAEIPNVCQKVSKDAEGLLDCRVDTAHIMLSGICSKCLKYV